MHFRPTLRRADRINVFELVIRTVRRVSNIKFITTKRKEVAIKLEHLRRGRIKIVAELVGLMQTPFAKTQQ